MSGDVSQLSGGAARLLLAMLALGGNAKKKVLAEYAGIYSKPSYYRCRSELVAAGLIGERGMVLFPAVSPDETGSKVSSVSKVSKVSKVSPSETPETVRLVNQFQRLTGKSLVEAEAAELLGLAGGDFETAVGAIQTAVTKGAAQPFPYAVAVLRKSSAESATPASTPGEVYRAVTDSDKADWARRAEQLRAAGLDYLTEA